MVQPWTPLESGWVKCNFDAVWDDRMETGGVDGVRSSLLSETFAAGDAAAFAQRM